MKNNNPNSNVSVVVSFIIVAAVVGLGVYGLMHKNPEMNSPVTNVTENVTPTPDSTNPNGNQSTSASTQTPKQPMQNRILANFTPTAHIGSLQKIDLVTGTGAEVKAGDTVSVQYTGAVAATGVIFQSSKDFGTDPVTFPLSGVIKGWTDGIPGMKVGGTRRLLIPASEAYGATPPPGSGIPPNADLVFDVELVAIK